MERLWQQFGPAASLIAVLFAAYTYAALLWLLQVRRQRWPGTVAACVTMAAPLLIPAPFVASRVIAILVCLELTLKMIDYSRQCHISGGELAEYLWFLLPGSPLSVTFRPRIRPLKTVNYSSELLSLAGSLFAIAAALLAVNVVNGLTIVHNRFLLDHLIKLVLLVVAVESLSRVIHRLEHLAGFDSDLLINNAWLAVTVGDFWRRYNTRIHRWLEDNVFRFVAIRSPVLGLLLAFFVSAVIHEVGFGIATSHWDGYQFWFFMLQAPAAMLSAALQRTMRRYGPPGIAAMRVATIAWFAVSSILFCRGVDRVFPWYYVSQSPLP